MPQGARAMLDGLEQMQARLQALKGLEGGRLRLGVVTSAKFFAPRILGHFLQQHPAIEPSLSVTQRDVLLQRMRDNLDDRYIFSVPPEGADLSVEPFMPNELVAIAARHHPPSPAAAGPSPWRSSAPSPSCSRRRARAPA